MGTAVARRVALVLVLVAAVAEVGLRVSRFGWTRAAFGAWSSAPPWDAMRSFDVTGDPVPTPGADAAWALAPGEPLVRYRLNRLGLREDRDVAPRPAPGTCRVLAVGDAYTFGYGVASRDAYPQRLEALLAAQGGHVEVLNGGFPNLDVEQQARRLAQLLPALAPDVVVVSFDWWNVPLGDAMPPERPRRWSRAWVVANVEEKAERVGQHVGIVHAGFDAVRRALTPGIFPRSGLACEVEPLASTPDRLGARWRRTEDAIARMAAASEAAGARFVVVVTPLDLQVTPARAALYRSGALPYPAHGFPAVDWSGATTMPAALARFADDAGIAVVDTTPAFRAATGARLFFDHDYHAAPDGHRVVAGEVARWFARTRPCDRR